MARVEEPSSREENNNDARYCDKSILGKDEVPVVLSSSEFRSIREPVRKEAQKPQKEKYLQSKYGDNSVQWAVSAVK